MPLDQTDSIAIPKRRRLLQTAGMGAAAIGALAVSGRGAPAMADNAAVSVADVLNFALNLEYLEAEFYLRATTGSGLPKDYRGGTGTQGSVTGGSRVPFVSSDMRKIAEDIASDEFAHVKFLRSALGSARVAEPAINLTTSFTTLARAAGIVGPNGTFNPFESEQHFLLGAYIFEDVGVSAYSGAAGYLVGNPTVLGYAAGILAVEAYHGGSIRTNIIRGAPALGTAADKISVLRAKLSGAKDDVGPVTGTTVNISDSDQNSIAFARTPAQVLNVVYGGGAASKYLFYPNRLNGAIS